MSYGKHKTSTSYFAIVVILCLSTFLYMGWVLAPVRDDGDGDDDIASVVQPLVSARTIDAGRGLALVPDAPSAPEGAETANVESVNLAQEHSRQGNDPVMLSTTTAAREKDTAAPASSVGMDEVERALAGAALPEKILHPGVSENAASQKSVSTLESTLPQAMYIVRPSDTLTGIARRMLGSTTRWRELARINADVLPDPHKLKPGMRLRLPVSREPDNNESNNSSQSASVATSKYEQYTVKKTDSLYSLAVRFYGSPRAVNILREANEDILAGDRDLHAGMVIRIPSASVGTLASGNRYTVRSGDTLSEIAKSVYGDSTRWKDIQDANTSAITDPRNLQVGTTLIIPED